MSDTKRRRCDLLGDERESVCDLATPDVAYGDAVLGEALYHGSGWSADLAVCDDRTCDAVNDQTFARVIKRGLPNTFCHSSKSSETGRL